MCVSAKVKTCLGRIIYTAVTDATICSKPGYLLQFYFTLGFKPRFRHVSSNAGNPKHELLLGTEMFGLVSIIL